MNEGAVFSSGMAAVTAVFSILSPNDHVICSEAAYGGGTYILWLTQFLNVFF